MTAITVLKTDVPTLVRRTASAPAKLRHAQVDAPKTLTCHICCESVCESNMYIMEEHAGSFHSACACEACNTCIKTWVELQLPQCVRTQHLRIMCLGDCQKTLPQQVVLQTSERARRLANNLEYRWNVLERNPFYPACMQVECQNAECVGIGYQGFETIMCMICQHQWDAVEEEISITAGNTSLLSDEQLAEGYVLAYYSEADQKNVGMKRCPNCKVLIEKNGGCDHMACRACKHEFWWTTGKPYR